MYRQCSSLVKNAETYVGKRNVPVSFLERIFLGLKYSLIIGIFQFNTSSLELLP